MKWNCWTKMNSLMSDAISKCVHQVEQFTDMSFFKDDFFEISYPFPFSLSYLYPFCLLPMSFSVGYPCLLLLVIHVRFELLLSLKNIATRIHWHASYQFTCEMITDNDNNRNPRMVPSIYQKFVVASLHDVFYSLA